MNSRIEIVTLADANYYSGLRATCLSIATFANDPSCLVFNIIDGGIHATQQDDLASRLQAVDPAIECQFIQPPEELFRDFPAYKGNKLTYVRLFLPDFFPHLDKILFCDSDTLWLARVEDLWSLMQSNDAIVAVRDPSDDTRSRENAWFEDNGLEPPGEGYFCAAIAMLNLQWMREHRIAEQAGEFVAAYPNLRFADQTIMNHLMRGLVRELPAYLHTISRIDHGGRLELPRVIHYAGELPWVCETRAGTISDMELIWHRFADVCVHRQRGVSLGKLYTRPDRCFKRLRYHLNALPGMQRLLVFLGRKLFRLNEAVIAKLTYSNRIRRADMKKAYAAIEAKASK